MRSSLDKLLGGILDEGHVATFNRHDENHYLCGITANPNIMKLPTAIVAFGYGETIIEALKNAAKDFNRPENRKLLEEAGRRIFQSASQGQE